MKNRGLLFKDAYLLSSHLTSSSFQFPDTLSLSLSLPRSPSTLTSSLFLPSFRPVSVSPSRRRRSPSPTVVRFRRGRPCCEYDYDYTSDRVVQLQPVRSDAVDPQFCIAENVDALCRTRNRWRAWGGRALWNERAAGRRLNNKIKWQLLPCRA